MRFSVLIFSAIILAYSCGESRDECWPDKPIFYYDVGELEGLYNGLSYSSSAAIKNHDSISKGLFYRVADPPCYQDVRIGINFPLVNQEISLNDTIFLDEDAGRINFYSDSDILVSAYASNNNELNKNWVIFSEFQNDSLVIGELSLSFIRAYPSPFEQIFFRGELLPTEVLLENALFKAELVE